MSVRSLNATSRFFFGSYVRFDSLCSLADYDIVPLPSFHIPARPCNVFRFDFFSLFHFFCPDGFRDVSVAPLASHRAPTFSLSCPVSYNHVTWSSTLGGIYFFLFKKVIIIIIIKQDKSTIVLNLVLLSYWDALEYIKAPVTRARALEK